MKFDGNSDFYFSLPNVLEAKKLLHERLSGPEQLNSRLVDKPLFLYGAGNLGLMACEYLKKIKILPEAIIDAKAPLNRVGHFYEEIRLLNTAKVPQEIKAKSLLAICIVSASYEEIRKSLENQGWLDIVPFYDVVESYRHIHPLSNGWFAKPFSSEDLVNIDLVIEAYADDISRAHYLQFLAWRRLRQEWHFKGALVQINNRFFIPEIKNRFSNQEVFVDVGAHNGSVSEKFLREVGGNFKQIIAIEPDKENFLKLNTFVRNQDSDIQKKFKFFNYFVDREAISRNFYSGLGYASQFSDMGNDVVISKTLDTLGFEPTYIKFHLEGFELNALKGAIKTINKYRPKISFTVYHNEDGITSSMKWLISNLNNYSFVFRMHGWCGTGAVIYAIPLS